MVEKKYPHIRLNSVATDGNYFGAYTNSDDKAKKGYTLFLATSEDKKDYCECMGYVHGKECYHLKEAKALSQRLMLGFIKGESGE